ncbi:hypothetical protein IMCC9480_2061 [Oxalobacteraceae bacterium IMCC9480]|nr:hypothetical protein IMCC9480_2061 [Oxalobacteraceae bacterium IMCC9480]
MHIGACIAGQQIERDRAGYRGAAFCLGRFVRHVSAGGHGLVQIAAEFLHHGTPSPLKYDQVCIALRCAIGAPGAAGTAGRRLFLNRRFARCTGTGRRKAGDETRVGGIDIDRPAGAEAAERDGHGSAHVIADQGLRIARHHIACQRNPDAGIFSEGDRAGDRDRHGFVERIDGDRLRDVDDCAIVDLRDGGVIDHVHDEDTVAGGCATAAAGGTQHDGQHAGIGGDVKRVGSHQGTVFDLRGDGIVVDIETGGGTNGRAPGCRRDTAAGAVRFKLELDFPVLAGTKPGYAGYLDIADDADRLHDAFGMHQDVPGGNGLRGGLVYFCAVLDGGACLVIHHQRRERDGARFHLALGGRIGPGIDQVVVQPQVAIEIATDAGDQVFGGGSRRRTEVFPLVRISEVDNIEVLFVQRRQRPVFVAATHIATGRVAVTDVDGIAILHVFRAGSVAFERGCGLVGVVLRDQFDAPGRVDLAIRQCIDTEFLTRIHGNAAGDMRIGDVVIDPDSYRQRHTEVGDFLFRLGGAILDR